MKVKKVIAVIVALAVTVGAAAGGIYGYKSYQKKIWWQQYSPFQV